MAPISERWIRDCEQLLYRAARLTDLAQWDELASLYLEDAKLLRPSDPDNPIVGRAAILASLRARPPRITCHVLSNIVVECTSAVTAHVSSAVILYAGRGPSTQQPAIGQKTSVGRFEDDVLLVNDVWAFAQRNGSILLEYELTSGAP